MKLKTLDDDYNPSLFDNNSSPVEKIIGTIWMFLVIGFVLAGILNIIFSLNTSEFIGLGFIILLLCIVHRFLGFVFAYGLLILLPLIYFLLF